MQVSMGRVRKMTEGLMDEEEGGVCRSDIYPKTSEKGREKKRRVYVGFMDLEKT